MRDFMSAELFDVLLYEEKNKFSDTTKRSYSALSLRIASENSRLRYNSKTVEVQNGTICYVPRDFEYKRTAEKEKLIVFHFRETIATKDEIVVFTPERSQKYKTLFEKALELWQTKPPGYKYSTVSVFYQILAELTKEHMPITKNTDLYTSKALEIIEQNFKDNSFRAESIAKSLFISETFLRRKFKKSTGKTVKQHITARRLQEAENLLESGYFSQKDIAKMCGFSDVKYFRAAFKAATGLTVKNFSKEKSS